MCTSAVEADEGAELWGSLFENQPMAGEGLAGVDDNRVLCDPKAALVAIQWRGVGGGKDVPIEARVRRSHSTCHFRSSWRFGGAVPHVNTRGDPAVNTARGESTPLSSSPDQPPTFETSFSDYTKAARRG